MKYFKFRNIISIKCKYFDEMGKASVIIIAITLKCVGWEWILDKLIEKAHKTSKF